MAEKTSEVDTLAFDLFSRRVAAHPMRQASEQTALSAYRDAEMFLAVRAKVQAGEMEPTAPEGPKLAEFNCPNLKRTHPHNLVSQKYGDLTRVNRIKKWLDVHPTPEKDPDEVLADLHREFSDINWDLPTLNVARLIFPHYCGK